METKIKFRPDPNLKLVDQVRQVLHYHRYAYRTEKTYCDWIVRFLRYHGMKKHPCHMGKEEVEAFLRYLATREKVSAATQRQALNAIVFLYRAVLDRPIDGKIEPVKAKRHRRLPVVLTQKEVQLVLARMHNLHLLMAQMLYGCGLRLMECIRLRVQDIDLEPRRLYVRAGKGGKDRVTVIPETIVENLGAQLESVKEIHAEDLKNGYGEVYLPQALGKKYLGAARELGWQYAFPAKKLSSEPRTGRIRRHHVLESGLQKAVKKAVLQAGLTKRATCQTFRHSFATHLLENSVNIRVVQRLMGHADVKMTEIYTHVMEKEITSLVSPLDALTREN